MGYICLCIYLHTLVWTRFNDRRRRGKGKWWYSSINGAHSITLSQSDDDLLFRSLPLLAIWRFDLITSASSSISVVCIRCARCTSFRSGRHLITLCLSFSVCCTKTEHSLTQQDRPCLFLTLCLRRLQCFQITVSILFTLSNLILSLVPLSFLDSKFRFSKACAHYRIRRVRLFKKCSSAFFCLLMIAPFVSTASLLSQLLSSTVSASILLAIASSYFYFN